MNKRIFRCCFFACLIAVAISLLAAYLMLCKVIEVSLAELLCAVLIGCASAVVLSYIVARVVVKPIEELDFEKDNISVVYEELLPLVSKIAKQNKTIEKQLKKAKQKEEEFRLITENMSEGLVIIDKITEVVTYNKSAKELLSMGDTFNGNILSLNPSSAFKAAVDKAMGGKRAECEIEREEKTYNLSATPVYEDDLVIGAVIVIIDITERRKREQLRREFTSNVSHELKTPLTSISGFAEMMKDGGTPDETVKDFSKSIYDESARLISLIGDIMKISELDENKVAVQKTEVDLFGLCKNICDRLRVPAQKYNVKLEVSGASVNVLGVEKILSELISNLVDNAIKYNVDGGRVDVRVDMIEQKPALIVADTGIGIPESDRNRVFERFYRVDKSRSRSIGGTGLGLSIVKHACMFHNADITLDSVEGKGTTIKVKFN